ncbi:RagB/SusD family nutrient uptake outer membrane protein [Thermophagus sp. OGC60D27]|uniref:RagB/SusD family nutrient uptake outer membrane protein n=1 Tax=Thermophagus sp. OGC60D27 TaxID=3458415 RepID=UPI00403789B2
MKRLNIYISTLLLVSLSLFSCEDYLDVPPEAEITEEQVFGSYLTYQGFIDQMYEKIVDYNGHAICVAQNLGGETVGNKPWNTAYMATHGDYRALGHNSWSRSNFLGYGDNGRGGSRWFSWEGIRIANHAIANIENLKQATEQERNLLLGQAYFFRAFFHWEQARAYGSIPYIEEVLAGDFQLPRYWEYKGKKNYQALAEKIDEDLAKAAELLPEVWPNISGNLGRITKGAALALKAKSLLYAGSPLMNEDAGNEAVFNKEYMERAAEAAWEMLKLAEEKSIYSLVSFENYQDNFAKLDGSMPVTSESILWKHKDNIGSGEINVFLGRLYLPDNGLFGGNAVIESPTQNYVDKFEMSDGTLYKTEYDNNNARRWDDRDPRFRKAIYVDGDMAGLDPSTKLELYEGGRTSTKNSAPLTPYVVHKFWPKGANKKDKQWNSLRFVTPHLRLAEIYLIYAEAVYEAYGSGSASAPNSSMTAVEAVNKVRTRAGMPALSSENDHPYESFRYLVRNERAVELCFEGHYWYDIRRWKTAKKEHPGGQLYTMRFDKDYTTFSREPLEAYVFEDRHYWLPFPPDDTYIYDGFPQNPGW